MVIFWAPHRFTQRIAITVKMISVQRCVVLLSNSEFMVGTLAEAMLLTCKGTSVRDVARPFWLIRFLRFKSCREGKWGGQSFRVESGVHYVIGVNTCGEVQRWPTGKQNGHC